MGEKIRTAALAILILAISAAMGYCDAQRKPTWAYAGVAV